ncbi:MAG: selenide, water dikinase SelD [Gemmatimonadetes bacterium]|nr:selenide, water dikinase SelD [Gemmatimonadota bacterium]
MSTQSGEFKLTEFSHGAGCGCKIAPAVLDQILAGGKPRQPHPLLLVGNAERDDAAVYDLGDGTAVVSTTDFFMPIVDDAHDFGRIASVNAISDVYAMGGEPLVAIAVLGWPVDKLPPEVAGHVVEGARDACADAGIPLGGGHSIDSPEPIFGLAVTGRVPVAHMKKNGGAKVGDQLFLTKPLGVGILTTAQKQKKLRPEHATMARDSMVQLNKVGAALGKHGWVHAMTDVTGFGLLGHLSEMCEASDCSAELRFDDVPRLDAAIIDDYLDQGCVPGGTNRNWASYGHKIGDVTDKQRAVLADPQTSGGLLVAVDPGSVDAFREAARGFVGELQSFGEIVRRADRLVSVS